LRRTGSCQTLAFNLAPLQHVMRACERRIRLAQHDGTSSPDTTAHLDDF
jgi:hypothetical protein